MVFNHFVKKKIPRELIITNLSLKQKGKGDLSKSQDKNVRQEYFFSPGTPHRVRASGLTTVLYLYPRLASP